MELLKLTTALTNLFEVDDPKKLGQALLECVLEAKTELFDKYVELVGGDMNADYLRGVYQYYCADRKEKKQDYTPDCIAALVSAMTYDSDTIVDMCAGSGSLTIQRWARNPNAAFCLYELDENVVPFLLFNLAARNINASVFVGDALTDDAELKYNVRKGERYGRVAVVEPSL